MRFSRLHFLKAATLSLSTESVDIFLLLLKNTFTMVRFIMFSNCELWLSQQTIVELRYVFNMSSPACLDGRLLSCIAFELLRSKANPCSTHSPRFIDGLLSPPRDNIAMYPLLFEGPSYSSWRSQRSLQLFAASWQYTLQHDLRPVLYLP